ncbi:hypothetical protein J5A56_00650 [Prevotella melaninogenica]|uniref:hypothetical protein n=1 Tax=Prevotella TaxID=838 RepID=UPI0003AD32AB|nr:MULTISPECIES: hypothetical protein [Prevotella]ERJ80071.1 hypothetical protein HMPREF9148_00157 [Prevotella sp. F0091]QUB72943.1 hypothetical protein J5A56_00650 [Prevotella melaninogenica]
MKVYRLDEIAKDVRIAIDQNMSSETLIGFDDVDTLSLNDIIKSKVTDAVKRIHSTAPAYLLDGGNNFGDAIYWKELESGWCLLPENFMRLVVFQMDDWERAVYNAISEDDAEYKKQSSRFKGIRGTPQKPVCAIAIRPEGRALEFYSCKSEDAMVSRAVYLPYPVIDEDDGIEICERCYQAVVYTIASLVLTTYGNADLSKALSDLAKSALI